MMEIKDNLATFRDYTKKVEDIEDILEKGHWQRAGGECICPKCGNAFSRHKNVKDYEWLTVICNGEIYKL